MEKRQLLSKLPSVDEALKDQRLFAFFETTARELVTDSVREVINNARQRILNGEDSAEPDRDILIQEMVSLVRQKKRHSLAKAINATGVVLHTNLGRARLSRAACENVVRTSEGYSTLEYDVKKGSRGSRHNHVEYLITKITGAEAAMVVNNNAAATMLCLSALAEGQEVLVSRGELVEIGGSFRIPDIMKQSGATLSEIGTTNKTRIEDYQRGINEQTAAIMKVHTSNYRIIGFTAETSLEELVALGKKRGIPVLYDMGCGLMYDLQPYGICEPSVPESLRTGIDVILFSGDKLLGGPQAGILAGRKDLIDKMKRHPLARVLRVDKMTLAALEETFRAYLDPEKARTEIPVLAMLTASSQELKERAQQLALKLETQGGCSAEVVPVKDQTGGGSAPTVLLDGWAVAIENGIAPEKMERLLRSREVPIIARIIRERVHFDIRTIADNELDEITEAVSEITKSAEGGERQ